MRTGPSNRSLSVPNEVETLRTTTPPTPHPRLLSCHTGPTVLYFTRSRTLHVSHCLTVSPRQPGRVRDSQETVTCGRQRSVLSGSSGAPANVDVQRMSNGCPTHFPRGFFFLGLVSNELRMSPVYETLTALSRPSRTRKTTVAAGAAAAPRGPRLRHPPPPPNYTRTQPAAMGGTAAAAAGREGGGGWAAGWQRQQGQ